MSLGNEFILLTVSPGRNGEAILLAVREIIFVRDDVSHRTVCFRLAHGSTQHGMAYVSETMQEIAQDIKGFAR